MNRQSIPRHLPLFVFLAVGLILCGCQPQTPGRRLHGQVILRNPGTNEVTIKHDEIPGFMPAMTMSYRLKEPKVMDVLHSGDTIEADVVTAQDGSYFLANIQVTNQSRPDKAPSVPSVQMLRPGEHVPDLQLINQDGQTIRLDSFRGKALLITFIYTRCPDPAFCPRLSSQFSKIHDDLAKTPGLLRKTHLLAISFDPTYDGPAILRNYGLAYLHGDPSGFAHWDFVSTAPDELRKLAETFGLTYFEQDNQIVHSMNIVLIAPDGTVSQYWSNDWTTAQLEDALVHAAQTASGSPAATVTNRKG